MEGPNLYDVIVIGAGIAGASAAYALASDARVCLIEAEDRPGVHATGRSAALFAPSYGGPEIRALTRASRSFFDDPPPGFSEQPLLHPRGCLYIARSDQRERLQQMVVEIQASGGHLDMLEPSAALARVGLLREDRLAAAALDQEAMDIDVDALHQGFLRGARARGADLLVGARAVTAKRESGRWVLALPHGELSAPVVVNAAGAWADEVAGTFGARPLGLRPLRRTALLVEAPVNVDVRLWPAVIDCDEEFYVKPDAGRLLLSPADETPDVPRDVHPDELDIAIAVDRVQGALALDVRRVSHSWAGLRTFAPDRTPVLGFDARAPGFFWCAGQGGYGVQTAPALGRTAASLVARQAPPHDVLAEGLDPERLSPRRFSARNDQATSA